MENFNNATLEQAELKLIRNVVKYQNRKLYDKTISKYITLKQIVSYIKNNEEVQITDAKSKEDITTKVLEQAITLLNASKEELVKFINLN